MKRDQRKSRPVLEGLEGRLPPSSLYPGGGQLEVRHDGNDQRGGNDQRDGHDQHDGNRQDNGSWEPKPISNGSTRPNVPTGPTGPVR